MRARHQGAPSEKVERASTLPRIHLREWAWIPLLIMFVSFLGSSFAQESGRANVLGITRLTTNGRANPLGIGAEDISFAWISESAERDVVQSAYEIRVGKSPGAADVWNSGVVKSDRQVDVVLPSQVKLLPATRYWWQVRIRDGKNATTGWSEPAWFETGLLSEVQWKGAEWIARPVRKVEPKDWTDYNVAVEFTLVNEALGILLRATPDARNGYLYQVNVSGDRPVLKPHKKVNGAYQELAKIDLSPFGVTHESLKQGKHTLLFNVRGDSVVTTLDGKKVDTRRDDSFREGLVGFRTYGPESALVHRVKVTNARDGRVLMEPDFAKGESGMTGGTVTGGVYQISGHTEAVFNDAPSSLPLLRGVIHAREKVTSARIYASALGLYELSVNGRKAGDQFLAPGWTDYHKRIQHQTYDVTDLIKAGPNVIGAALADGWYRGKVGLGWSGVYGDALGWVAKIKLTYADGSTEWSGTGRDWRAVDGPFVRADLQDGETYDASREQTGWNTSDFDASRWEPVEPLASRSNVLTPQPDEPVRVIDTLSAKTHTSPVSGSHVYDLGQNMVGVVRLTMTGRKGQTVTIRHAEELYRKGDRKGQLYTDNFRSARVTDRYTFATEGTATYQPTFTQHGFRYVELTGLDEALPLEAVKGVVLGSALPDIGDLRTSNPMLNQLVSNIRWGQRGNFVSIPTDTPARDERLGWTGDISVFAPTASRYQDTRAFLSKWMSDVRDAQKPDGNLPAVVPQPRREFDQSGVGWTDAAITVPYAVWKASGDERIVRENWEAMKKFYDFVHRSATRDGNLIEEGRSCWFSGDWLNLEKVNRLEEHKVIATAYFAENTRMMAEMADAMGETGKAKEWRELHPRIRDAFAGTFRKPDGSIYTGTQTAYAMALGMDLIRDREDREETAAKFVEKLAADGYHLRTGFLGTPWLLPALSSIGRDDLAYRLLLNEDYPSWGFEIKMGATTMWERWNTIRADGEFGPVDMNSFNHYAYGAVADWMYGNIGGLQALEPGYKVARIAPLIGQGGLSSAKSTLRTPYGTLASDWTTENGNRTLKVEVPANTTAEVIIPAVDPKKVLEGGVPADSAPGVKSASFDGGHLKLVVGSGRYQFSVE
jgi:alpha-L-rhamnosidase